MNSKKLIQNYSLALFESAVNAGLQEVIFEQITQINQAINSDSKIKEFMCSPIVQNREKARLIEFIARRVKVEILVQNFLLLLTKNSRMSILPDVVIFYNYLLDESKNIKPIRVTSSKILSAEEKKQLNIYLEKHLKQKVTIEFHQDESIIGGIIIHYDSNLIDNSIAGALDMIGKKAKNIIVKGC